MPPDHGPCYCQGEHARPATVPADTCGDGRDQHSRLQLWSPGDRRRSWWTREDLRSHPW